ncbi:MAG: cyclic nucleotide-binding domain-containing protein [Deltaproteobacteria bacterium]|nr:cyclic nucleotide-binding domain-containing protein [Deltaproteobacteria bacterium]
MCQQTRPAISCFIIVSGVVDVVKESQGRERLLTRLPAGAIAGQLALVDHAPRSASLIANTEVTALELTRDVFDRLVHSESPLGYRFQMEIAIATGRQLRDADRRLVVPPRGPDGTATPGSAREAEPAHLRDSVADLDVPVEPFDIVEINQADRVVDTLRPPKE